MPGRGMRGIPGRHAARAARVSERQAREHLRFASNKIVALRTYLHLLNSGEPEISTSDDPSPHDATSHGTAVAMVAAGVCTDSPAGPQQGDAPGAHLGIYRVSGTPGIKTHATSPVIIAAIEDALTDGLDILNLSLGAPAGPSAASGPPSNPALNSVSTPVIARDVIAVAATWNSREIVQGVRVGSAAYPA